MRTIKLRAGLGTVLFVVEDNTMHTGTFLELQELIEDSAVALADFIKTRTTTAFIKELTKALVENNPVEEQKGATNE
jgi:hypothetical protein